MWSEWTPVLILPEEASSPLAHLPSVESGKIISALVTSLIKNCSVLESEQQVTWCLEVLQYGLFMDSCELVTDDCVSIYCQWLSCLLPNPDTSIPGPILRDKNHMARKMLPHLYLLFKKIDPEKIAENGPFSLRVTLCIKVLRLLEDVGKYSTVLERETWQCLLSVLLSISDHVLSQPGTGGQLCYTVVSVLLHSWLSACAKSFPEPTMWATLISLVSGWRHRIELVSHWSKINLALLSKQLVLMYGPSFPFLSLDSCCSGIQMVMTPECVVQSSFRFLHILGNICELSQPNLVSKSQPFLQAALSSPDVVDPHSHPCLDILPDIFLKAVSGVSQMVDAYLGCERSSHPLEFSPLRSKCNSILHLFGPWLFQAALVGTKVDGFSENKISDNYFEGRAEALGTLCIILSAKKFREDIETPYLARFFMAIQQGLRGCPLLIKSIIRYSSRLMVLDLPGANILVPDIVHALLSVLDYSTNIFPSHLSLCSIELAKTVSAIPTQFAGMITTRLHGSHEVRSMETYQGDLFKFLLSSLQTESDPDNCQQLLCTLAVVVELQAVIENKCTDTDANDESDTPEVVQRVMGWITDLARLVSHRLISSWSTDYQTSLAAIELLSVLAESRAEQDGMECKRILRWICDFIALQCNRPPPAHSRDLHSSIIAAFQACSNWLVHRPTLLEDKECLLSVLEVAELAISGSKSKVKASDIPMPKEEKILSPISKRVRCAAEDLISIVMQRVGYFSGCSLSEKVSTQLNEEVLAEKLGSAAKDPWYSPTEGFKYFMSDKSYIICIAKDWENTKDQSVPSAVIVFRGATGKSTWMLRLKNVPYGKGSAKDVVPKRPVGHILLPPDESEPPSNFPTVDVSQICAVDCVIPTIDNRSDTIGDLETLDNIISQQIEAENLIMSKEGNKMKQSITITEPRPSSKYQICRLVLSHLGLLSIPRMEDESLSLVELDSSSPIFWEELKSLDKLSARTQDTVLVYYVKNGQTSSSDILSNSLSADLPSSYLSLLSSIGWQVELGQHTGWAGQPVKTSNNEKSHILYWADEFTELAILVPCQPYVLNESFDNSLEAGNLDGYCASPKPGPGRVIPNRKSERMMDDQLVVVAWLENMEDATKFPLSHLVPNCSSVCMVIFLQPLDNGLVRVKVTGWNGKPRCVAPLGDGMVVSPLVIGQLVRQAAVNMSRRTRLESDYYHITPSTRRRSALQNIGEKFACPMDDMSTLLESLFT